MKILAIRGKNLASLAGEFEIYLDREPLASSNLFAICGPTGSGKSTLLDALCLALYDKTPRLNRDRANSVDLPDVGKETITPRDPRYLLRRGTGEGFAEVDFVGNDGVEYRARWSVQRAHRKMDRPLQDTKMELRTLANEQPIGGKKSEVLEEIRKRLGLQFDQFTRAVLLAQNEFATFLKAKDDDRAELLQMLTGLDIYEKISIRAHQRAKAEQQTLDDLNAQRKGHQTLVAEERAELERKLTAARADAATLAHRKAELDQQIRWHESWENLKQAEQQAREALQKAVSVQESAAQRWAYFSRVESVQDARPHATEVERTTGEIAANRRAVFGAEDRVAETQRDRLQAEDALAQISQAIADAEQAKTAANPDLDKARELDNEIELRLIPDHAAAAKGLEEARQAEAEARKRLESKQTEYQQVTGHLQAARGWLTKHQPLRVLAEDWPRWDVLLKDAAIWQNSLREAEKKVASSQQDMQRKQQEQATVADACAKAEAALYAAETRLQAVLDELAGFDAETLATRRQTTQIRLEQLGNADQLWNTLIAAQTQQRELEDESRKLQEQIVRAETALNQLSTDKPAAMARLEQAEKSLKIAEAANNENVEKLRASLESDSPCPVCGATDHPYSTGDAPSRAMLAGLKAEVDQCRKALESLAAQESARQTDRDKDRQRLIVLTEKQKSLTATLLRDNAAWNAHPLAAELSPIAPVDRSVWLTDQQQLTQSDLTAITQQENAQRKIAKRRDDAQKARDQTQKQHSTVQNALNAAQNAFNEATRTAQIAQERQIDCARQLAERLTDLDAAFSGHDWRPLWQADPVQFHEQRRQKVAQWNDQSQRAELWQKRTGELEIEINSDTAIATDKTTQRKRTADAFQIIDGNLKAQRQRRQALFDGRPVTAVEAALAKAVEDAKIKHQQQNLVRQKAAEAQASAEAVLEQAKRTLIASQQAADRAGATLDAWMVEYNTHHPDNDALDYPQLCALLAHDSIWLTRERKELQQITDAVRDGETTLRERLSRRKDHERQRTTPNPADRVRAELARIAEEREQAKQRATESELILRQDDERRARTATLEVGIAKQQAISGRWSQLDQLIGSSDGKKFRNYAQQFTLDVLLGYANHHLADLSRRYRLERVKDTLALMVVDQDMGDEPRSVHSLSGGESFLVSLALALGLASLSSNRVQVESLFIDEGFGSLDTDTLRVAMDALDKLQAQGRKVGVISHVQDMTERIGVQIQVRRQSGGQSRIEVRSV